MNTEQGPLQDQESVLSLSRLVSAANQGEWAAVDAALLESPKNEYYMAWAEANSGIKSQHFKKLAEKIIATAKGQGSADG